MLGRVSTNHVTRVRSAVAIAASAATIGALAALPAASAASARIELGAGEASLVVDGTTVSTSSLSLEQLANLQGVPPATLRAELDGIAVGTPFASTIEALVARLPLGTSLASALDQISGATGGAIAPRSALRRVVEESGTPGTAGVAGGGGPGAAGSPGASGGAGGAGSQPAPSQSKTRFTLKAGSRSLKGRPGSRVRVRFTVSAPAKLSYGGKKLAKGSRRVKTGANVLTVKMPRKHGNYVLVLNALGPQGQRAQAAVALHDAIPVHKRRHH